MKIYTKKGDMGETGLVGNVRVPKDDLRIRAYGTLDELNAILGVTLAEIASLSRDFVLTQKLTRVQSELFQLGAELATPRAPLNSSASSSTYRIETLHTQKMEQEIDEMENRLQPLKNFILPGGTKISAFLHLARTISRRAEREVTTLHRAEPQRPEVLAYINRLSDFLFVCARFANFEAGISDIPWVV